jgi:hypothetical protein
MTSINDLPEELLTHISSFMDCESYINFHTAFDITKKRNFPISSKTIQIETPIIYNNIKKHILYKIQSQLNINFIVNSDYIKYFKNVRGIRVGFDISTMDELYMNNLEILNFNLLTVYTCVNPLYNFSKLKELSCSFMNINHSIDNLINLNSLTCTGTNIKNVNSLINLEYLSCCYTEVSDVSNLKKLKIMRCSNTLISEICNLPLLSIIFVESTPIKSLYNLPKLRDLYCSFTQIKYINNFNNLKNCICINSLVAFITNCESLEGLICDDTPITDVNNLTNLQVLSCKNCTNLPSKLELVNLKELYYDNSSITNIEFCVNIEIVNKILINNPNVNNSSQNYISVESFLIEEQ